MDILYNMLYLRPPWWLLLLESFGTILLIVVKDHESCVDFPHSQLIVWRGESRVRHSSSIRAVDGAIWATKHNSERRTWTVWAGHCGCKLSCSVMFTGTTACKGPHSKQSTSYQVIFMLSMFACPSNVAVFFLKFSTCQYIRIMLMIKISAQTCRKLLLL